MSEVAESEAKPDFDHKARVEVLNLKTNREVKFDVPWTYTLQQVWKASYGEFDPPEQPGQQDKFQCEKAGADLTPYLGLTLREAHERHICVNRKYQIVGGTGGA